MKSKRQLVKEQGTKKKYQLPTLNESIMIVIFLSIVWFAWGQFQFPQDECCENPNCEELK